MTIGYNHIERAKDLLKVDALDLARELATDETQVAGLGLSLLHALHREKKTSLSKLCDTYYRMPWAEIYDVLRETGFEVVSKYMSQGRLPAAEYIIAAHPQKKLLLTAHSSTFSETGPVLDHTLFIHGQADDYGDPEKRHAVYSSGGSIHPVEDTKYALTYHVTDGLKIKLQELEDLGISFIDWLPGKDGPLNKLHFEYGLTEQQLLDGETRVRSSLPQWVKDFTQL